MAGETDGTLWYSFLLFWRSEAVERRVRGEERSPENGYSDYESSRGCAFLTFSWIVKWIHAVAYGNVDYESYPRVPKSDFDTFAATEFGLHMKECRENHRGPIFDKVVGNMRLAILRVFKCSFLYLLSLTFFKDALEIVNIYLLKKALQRVVPASASAIITYLGSAGILVSVLALGIFIDGFHHFYYRRLCIRIEVMLHIMLFGKILSKDCEISSSSPILLRVTKDPRKNGSPKSSGASVSKKESRAHLDDATILNLALFDVYEVSIGAVRMIDLINVPMKVFLLGCWLYHEIGIVSLRAVGLVLMTTCVMILCECECAFLLKDYVCRVDLRMLKTQVVLEGLREIRLIKWIGYAMDSVFTSRMQELQLCLKRSYLSCISGWVGVASPSMMTLFIFVMAAKTDSPVLRGMNLEKSFSIPLIHALTYFIRPFKKLPSDINDHLETSLSCRRLEEFIYKKTLDFHIPTIYDEHSVRVDEPNIYCQHPYQVDLTLFSDNGERRVLTVLIQKTKKRLPIWMMPTKRRASENVVPRSHASMDEYNMAILQLRDSITADSDILGDTYMGVAYPHVVKLSFATFESCGSTILSNISLTLYANQVSLITGPSGSGKSCLLNAILGHYKLVSGSFCVVPLEVNLPIGYVAQEPWIQVGSVRECILFGHALDSQLYHRIVTAVGLDVDFESWELGDLRVVDEGGQNLSTGQRMRVSLARCLYNQMMHSNNIHAVSYTLYCLDDFFSVLDPSMSLRIFDSLFGHAGLLHGSCVIMAIQDEFIHTVRSHGLDLSCMDFLVYHMKGLILDPYGETIDNLMSRRQTMPLSADTLQIRSSDFSTTIFAPKEDRAAVDTTLSDTKQATGSIKLQNFVWFFNNVGLTIVVVLFFVSIASVSLTIINDQIIRSWGSVVDESRCKVCDLNALHRSEDMMLLSENYDSSMKQKINHYYMLVLIVSIKIIVCLCISLLETLGTIQAATRTYTSALEGILRSPVAVFNSLSIGVINNRLSTDQSYVDYKVFSRFSYISSMVIFSIMSIVSLCVMNWWSGIFVPIVLLLIYIAVIRDYLPMCRENTRAILGTRAALCTVISQTVYGSNVIRASRREGATMSQFLRYLEAHQRVKFLSTAAVAWSNIRLRLLLFPVILVNILSPLIQLIWSGTTCGTVLTANVSMALSYSIKLGDVFKTILSLLVDITTHMCASQRLQDMSRLGLTYDKSMETIRLPYFKYTSDDDDTTKKCDTIRFPHKRLGVVIRNIVVDYEYIPNPGALHSTDATQPPKSDTSITRRSSMKCEYLYCAPGEHIGIIGRTGSGKSTLLSALAGALELAQGSIELDGVDISRIADDEALGVIGNIPHNPPLLVHWTVRDYVDPCHQFEDVEIWDALFKCSIGTFIKSLPGKQPLDVVLKKSWQGKCKIRSPDDETPGNEGVQILDIYLQYLTLARLILYKKDMRMLLVDEPFLIGKNEFESLTPLHVLLRRHFSACNVFLVAHHAESLQLCDRILVVDSGKVVGECLASNIPNQQALADMCCRLSNRNQPPYTNC